MRKQGRDNKAKSEVTEVVQGRQEFGAELAPGFQGADVKWKPGPIGISQVLL